jgi:peptidyl-prolyl cis-trans isomerase C
MRRTVVIVLLIAAGAAAAGAAGQVLADVGARQVTIADLKAELQEQRAGGSAAAIARSVTADGRAAALDRLVARQLMAQAATRDGLGDDPAVKARIDAAVGRILAVAYEERLLRTTDTSDEALRAYFDAHQQDFRAPPRVRARHVLLATREAAAAARADLVKGADFATVARERSVDPYTRETGGDLGWISAGTMVKPFEDALFALAAGGVSEVVESSYGFHVIRADEIKPGGVPSFGLVRDEVRARVLDAALEASTAALKRQYVVTVHPDALKALER